MKSAGREAFSVMDTQESEFWSLEVPGSGHEEIGYFEDFYMADKHYVMRLQPCTQQQIQCLWGSVAIKWNIFSKGVSVSK